MKKMLILNGSHSEITLIEEAHKLGYYVITSGNDPSLLGHNYADEYIKADYSDKDAILQIVKENHISAIVSCANDFGIITAAYVAEKMGFVGHDSYKTTLLLHQKDNFKSFAIENNLRVPFSKNYSDLYSCVMDVDNHKFPMIIKPVDLTGGKGVSIVNNREEYIKGVVKAFDMTRKGAIVVEQFIKGTYHSFSSFVVDGKVKAYFSDNEYSKVYRFFVDTSAGPADYIDDVKNILIEQVEIIADKLKLVNGVFHMQYVMDDNHNPYIMDITRRCSGDIYPEPVERATGLPWSKWIVMSETGCASDTFIIEESTQQKYCGRHCIMADSEGYIKRVIIDESLKNNIYKVIKWWTPGFEIKNHLINKAGIVFYEFSSRDEMISKVSKIKELIKVELE